MQDRVDVLLHGDADNLILDATLLLVPDAIEQATLLRTIEWSIKGAHGLHADHGLLHDLHRAVKGRSYRLQGRPLAVLLQRFDSAQNLGQQIDAV